MMMAFKFSRYQRPIGRDKAKAEAQAKAKPKLTGKAGLEASEYDLKKLRLIDDLSSINRVKTEAIEKFEHRIDKLYEIEQQKMEMERKKMEMKQKKLEMQERKLLFIDTTHMNPYQQAEHEALCNEVREKYGYARHD
ncbi:hypothetical protein L1987_51264 [Smallanthus sonchifolius]|uniref:Uncharacterized protein n=1 Tax=Smallanthus sonchifolius TaxID=185202 RepID=A0ACB9EPS9_9ASTR|nr:hypothetical protein L1987_51264 [Smallanthus sonchifolius]